MISSHASMGIILQAYLGTVETKFVLKFFLVKNILQTNIFEKTAFFRFKEFLN